METLNWVIGTQAEWEHTGLPVSPYARRFNIETFYGTQEVILQHVDIHAIDLETLVRKMPANNILSDASLQMILPVEVTNE